MKSTELRIGNWIHNPVQKIDFQIDIVAFSRIYYDELSKLPQRFEPIKITGYVLLRCGFTLYSNEGRYLITPNDEIELLIAIESDNETTYCHIDIYQHIDKEDDEGAEIVYLTKENYTLHELQNLFFSLTKTELVYTPLPRVK